MTGEKKMDRFLTLDEIIVIVNVHIISLNGDLYVQYIWIWFEYTVLPVQRKLIADLRVFF